MRKTLAIINTTALEVLSEPLSLLLTIFALVLTIFAPAFHYHQFGEVTRMARDAGFSALFTCGNLLAIVGAIRTFRSEIESGTAQMVLSHPISRMNFAVAKVLGTIVAYSVFGLIVFAVMLVMVEGAAIGGLIAERNGDIARIWAPNFSLSVAIIVLPLMIGAMLNWAGRFRFVLTFFKIAAGMSALSLVAVMVMDRELVCRALPVALLIMVETAVMTFAAAIFAIRFKTNSAAVATLGVFLAAVPALGNYYQVEMLANGGSLSWSYFGLAVLAAVPALALFVFLLNSFIVKRDIQ